MKELLRNDKKVLHRVLIILPGSLDFRGIQMFFLNILKYIDYSNLGIDLYFGGKNEREEMLEMFSFMGLSVYIGELNVYSRSEHFKYRQDLKELMSTREYDGIHVNSGKPWFNMIAVEEAKKSGICKRIVHSHSSHLSQKSYLKRMYKEWMCNRINRLATDCFACSETAGVWMFGQKHFDNYGQVLNNGIDTKQYIFSSEKRKAMREEYNMQDNHVLLHVGAFNSSKNQAFLVKMFGIVRQRDPLAKLIMVGTGEFQDSVKHQVEAAGLIDDVVFVGASSRVPSYMHMADLFVLPSVFEGLGIVNIEAQATGLKCIVSDVVPPAAKVTELLEFVSLEKGHEYWAEVVLNALDGYKREDMTQLIREKGYDSQMTAQKLQEIYYR